MGPDLLESIVAATLHEVESRQRRVTLRELEREARKLKPGGSVFRGSLVSSDGINVIAECKGRSPSAGLLRAGYEPAAVAEGYAAAGAVAISVLTEAAFFDGDLGDLMEVRAAVRLPVLRKDFIVTEYQLHEAQAAGADAVLLIVAALGQNELKQCLRVANACGLATLVEVHDQRELDRALGAGAEIIGVNNRNLRTLTVDLDVSYRLVEDIPESMVAVAESGIARGEDLVKLRRAGYDAFLMGEALMKEQSPGLALKRLLTKAGSVSRSTRVRN